MKNVTIKILNSVDHRTHLEIIELDGIYLGGDSFGRELWQFDVDGEIKFAERTVDLDGDEPDYWTSNADDLEGWFPDSDINEWEDDLLD